MPTNKDFKRLVRGRMRKTGEAYTTARAHLLEQKPTAAAPPKAPRTRSVDYAKLAGRGDAVLKAKTGCTWERWVKALDHAQAYTWPHREIAKLMPSHAPSCDVEKIALLMPSKFPLVSTRAPPELPGLIAASV